MKGYRNYCTHNPLSLEKKTMDYVGSSFYRIILLLVYSMAYSKHPDLQSGIFHASMTCAHWTPIRHAFSHEFTLDSIKLLPSLTLIECPYRITNLKDDWNIAKFNYVLQCCLGTTWRPATCHTSCHMSCEKTWGNSMWHARQTLTHHYVGGSSSLHTFDMWVGGELGHMALRHSSNCPPLHWKCSTI